MSRTYIALVIVVMMAGCAVNGDLHSVDVPDNLRTGDHPIRSSRDLQYLSCDYQTWDTSSKEAPENANLLYWRRGSSSMHVHSKEKLKVAKTSYVHALFANNVYRSPKDKPIFQVPTWEMSERKESKSGLALEVWQKKEAGKTVEVIVAYKGTDFKEIPDWKANLSIWREPEQYREAQEHFKSLLKKEHNLEVPISVAGHSLGGGIALNVSLRHSTHRRPIRAFAFNTSPRAFYRPINPEVAVERYLLDERGEFLSAARLIWSSKFHGLPPPQTYNFLDFNYFGAKPVSEHSIYLFTRALLLIAVNQGDKFATEVFRTNFTISQFEAKLPSSRDLAGDKDFDLGQCAAILQHNGPVRR